MMSIKKISFGASECMNVNRAYLLAVVDCQFCFVGKDFLKMFFTLAVGTNTGKM